MFSLQFLRASVISDYQPHSTLHSISYSDDIIKARVLQESDDSI